MLPGFILFSAWSWNFICAPDAFSWNFGFALLNMLQLFHAVYRLRPVKFDPELEEVYRNLFQPFKVRLSTVWFLFFIDTLSTEVISRF